jgi:hypothetical protein
VTVHVGEPDVAAGKSKTKAPEKPSKEAFEDTQQTASIFLSHFIRSESGRLLRLGRNKRRVTGKWQTGK